MCINGRSATLRKVNQAMVQVKNLKVEVKMGGKIEWQQIVGDRATRILLYDQLMVLS
jgi:hypothetical protein